MLIPQGKIAGLTRALANLAETPGAKLRRLARAAENTHPWALPPMRAASPWQPSTAYAVGAVVVNGGYLFVCVIAGTSAATGGPTNTTSGAATADGTASWTYWAGNVVTVDPFVTQAPWIASTAYALAAQVTANGNVYACVVAGTSTTGTGPTATTSAVTDGTVTWTYLGALRQNPYTGQIPAYSYSTTAPTGLTHVYTPGNGLALAVVSAQVGAGGSGYVVGDTITLTGGTFATAAVLLVTGVVAGAVTGVSLQTAGSYSVLPGVPAAQGSTSGVGTGATFYLRWADPPWVRCAGCYLAGAFSGVGYGAVSTFQPAAGAAPLQVQYAFEFMTDAPKLYLRLPNASGPFSLVVDGVRYSVAGIVTPAAANNYHLLDWSATGGGKKVRRVRLEFKGGTAYVPVVAVDTGSQVWAPGTAERTRAVFISDSLGAGSTYGPMVPGNALAFNLAHELGLSECWALFQTGTGYANRGAGAGVTTDAYGYRIAEALALNPDLWVLFGSTNDNATAAGTITAAVTAAIAAIRAGGSVAPVVVFGVWPLNNANVATTEAAVKAGMLTADPLAKTFFIPLYNDPYLPWVTGSWNNNPAPSGVTDTTSTSATMYISGDATHPPDLGTAYLAARMARAIRTQVYPSVL